MEESDQVEVDEPEVDQLWTSERTIIEENVRDFKENKERFLKCRKELTRVSLLHRTKKGEAMSFEEYKEILREKMSTLTFDDSVFIYLPRDIELTKKLSQYSVKEIKQLSIEITELNENVLECLQKFLRSFAYTQIRSFYLSCCSIRSAIKKHDNLDGYSNYFRKVPPCSNFFEELSYTVSRATNKIKIYELELSNKEFIQLVKAAKKVKSLSFFGCKILFDSEFDFCLMEGCLIEDIVISFIFQVYDELSEYEESMMNIFRGILNCKNLIRSLKDLNFRFTHGLKEKMIEEAKKILGEENLKIMPCLKRFIDS